MLIVASSTDLNLGEKSQGSCEFCLLRSEQELFVSWSGQKK